MREDIVHLIYVPFTGLGLNNGYRGDDWLKYRINIFKEYVLPSLLNQSNHNFILWISWRPEEVRNNIVHDFMDYFAHKRFPFSVVSTFNGIMFWDDKYPNDALLSRLRATLPSFKQICKGKKWVYMTLQPSDDMHYYGMVDDVQAIKPAEKIAIGFRKGYILNLNTKEMAEYNPTTNPPFYTLVFPRDTFIDADKHFKYIKELKSHEYVPELFKFYQLDTGLYERERGYCVGIHGANISTVWNHPFKGQTVGQDKLKLFGIENSKLIDRKWSAYLLARAIFNKLPMRNIIKKMYYKYVILRK